MKTEVKDPELWKQAKARGEFKNHLIIYLIVNIGLWLIWFLTRGTDSNPWPIYPTFIWGIGVVANYFSAYRLSGIIEHEYEKLAKK